VNLYKFYLQVMMNKIDEALYSRQLYVLGRDAMEKMSTSHIFISGMNGLGLEIAKCIILGGVKSVTIHDESDCNNDWTNYYAGDKKIKSCMEKLQELNSYVEVKMFEGSLKKINEKVIKQYNVFVICNNYELSKMIKINNMCRKNNVKYILCNSLGLMGQIFCDFGDKFIVRDNDGEESKIGIVSEILMHDDQATIICIEPHELYDGDYVKFYGLGDNDAAYKIKIVNRHKFIVDKKFVGGIQSNISFEQVKMPMDITFKSLKDSIEEPTFVNYEKSLDMHSIFVSLEKNKKIPKSWNTDEVSKLVNIAHNKNNSIDKDFVTRLCNVLDGSLCAMHSVIGGIVAQEVMKACTGKFMPINQWFYFESVESASKSKPSNIQPYNNEFCRYNEQVKIFGREIQEKINNSKIFVVGAGAIGCEHLKNFSMMGIGNIVVTDMDNIEKSNLNRQFLFRSHDIGKSKSYVAAREAKKINPLINIQSYEHKVCPETSQIFNEPFYKGLLCVANALDNVQARLYVDSQCVMYKVPLLESGTLGSKGNTQSIIPHMTENYGSTHDPQEKSVPICTLKNFPYMIEHCIQYARDLFEGLFNQSINNFIKYTNDIESLKNSSLSDLVTIVEDIKNIIKFIPNCYDDCLNYGYNVWKQLFNDQIVELMKKFPRDHKTEDGTPFWSGAKKYPTVAQFDMNNTLHTNFVIQLAGLWAQIFGLSPVDDKVAFNMLKKIKKSVAKTNKIKKEPEYDNKEQVLKDIPDPAKFKNIKVYPIEFDKDNNDHMEFVTSSSNLRALNYGIQTVDKHKTKGIAGKIIPAIATSTSLVSGLVSLELYKLFNSENKICNFRNYFVNLAIPLFTSSEPGPLIMTKVGKFEFNNWDSFEFNDPTPKDIIDHFAKKYEIDIGTITMGQIMVISPFLNKPKYEERLNMKIKDVYKEVTKENPPNPFTISLMVETDSDDEDSDDVDNLPDCKIYY